MFNLILLMQNAVFSSHHSSFSSPNRELKPVHNSRCSDDNLPFSLDNIPQAPKKSNKRSSTEKEIKLDTPSDSEKIAKNTEKPVIDLNREKFSNKTEQQSTQKSCARNLQLRENPETKIDVLHQQTKENDVELNSSNSELKDYE